jgi:stage III sporulation protein AA
MKLQKNNYFIKKNLSSDKNFDSIIEYLDYDISNLLEKIPKNKKEVIEEIRLRVGNPLMVTMSNKDYFVTRKGELVNELKESYIVTRENIYNTFRLISNFSVYAFEEEIKNGFITIKGGHRVGVAGKVVYGKNGLETIKNISSLNIRIARQKLGVSNNVIKYLIKKPNTIYHTLIVSPPQCGKTTLLRDIVRNISNGVPKLNFKGLKVGLVDERSEIASVYNGYPQKDVGVRTDILDGCQKHDGIIMLIRSMSPAVIATDELGDVKDIKAIHEALRAGVKIIATVHGEEIEDIKTKPNLKEIINEKIFERIIILDNSMGVGTVRDILDGKKYESLLNREG